MEKYLQPTNLIWKYPLKMEKHLQPKKNCGFHGRKNWPIWSFKPQKRGLPSEKALHFGVPMLGRESELVLSSDFLTLDFNPEIEDK